MLTEGPSNKCCAGGDRAREQVLWLSTEQPGVYPQAVAALRAAGLVAQLGTFADEGDANRQVPVIGSVYHLQHRRCLGSGGQA